VLRLILSGAFDAYPKLQVIVGHLGEALPFMMQRIDRTMAKEVTGLDRPTADYLRENVYYTLSGFNFTAPFLNLLLEVGADRIMFSADYPHMSMPSARAFLDELPVSTVDKEKIAHGNAERLLKLQP
jgi:predicted TIM-barrel fold metal-dependent hydrolase